MVFILFWLNTHRIRILDHDECSNNSNKRRWPIFQARARTRKSDLVVVAGQRSWNYYLLLQHIRVQRWRIASTQRMATNDAHRGNVSQSCRLIVTYTHTHERNAPSIKFGQAQFNHQQIDIFDGDTQRCCSIKRSNRLRASTRKKLNQTEKSKMKWQRERECDRAWKGD